MTIRERILARPDLADLRAARDIDGLAAALNAEGALVLRQRFVTARAVMAECPGGVGVLVALESARSNPAVGAAVEWALTFLGQEAGLDIGDPFTQSMVDGMVSMSLLTSLQGEALKSMARLPLTVTRTEVNDAMFNPDGSEK